MKILLAAVSLLLLLVCGAFAQKTGKVQDTVIWGVPQLCHKINSDDVRAARPECSGAEVNGATFYILNYKGVTYALGHRPDDRFVIASVQISNKSGQPLALSPFRSRLVRYESEQDFLAGVKPSESHSAQSHDELQQRTYVEAPAVEVTEGGIRPGLQVKEVYRTVIRNGRLVTVPVGVEPKANTADDPRAVRTTTSLLISRLIFDHLLTSKTLADQEKKAGHVVFKKPKLQGFFVFVMNVGDKDFIFPVGTVVSADSLATAEKQ